MRIQQQNQPNFGVISIKGKPSKQISEFAQVNNVNLLEGKTFWRRPVVLLNTEYKSKKETSLIKEIKKQFQNLKISICTDKKATRAINRTLQSEEK